MKSNRVLVAIFSATAISGVFIGSTNQAQACWRTSQLTSANSAGQSPQSFNSTTASTGQSPLPFNSATTGTAAGIALLGGILAVGGIYLSRRRQSEPVLNEAEYESELPTAPVDEQVSERELVGSRK